MQFPTGWEAISRATISVSLADIKTATGLSDADLAQLGQFEMTIEADMTLTDGSVVASSQIINTGLFQSAIFFPAHRLVYCALPASSAQPKATLTLTDGDPLAATDTDVIEIEFDSDIDTPPTVSLSPNNGTLGTITAVDSKNFTVQYTAPAGFTGTVVATVSGAISDDSGVVLAMADTDIDLVVDNEVPIQVSADPTGSVGRQQFTELVVEFNEAIFTAPNITITGQGLRGCRYRYGNRCIQS